MKQIHKETSKMVWARCFVFIIFSSFGVIFADHETMRSITHSFLKVLDVCKHELNLPENILVDLYHFWKEDQELMKRDTGCAIACMSKKLDLVDPSGKLHHGNAQEFALRHGAAEEVAKKLVTMVHECERQHEVLDDECTRALEIAKCFRGGIHELNWAPKMEVMVGEVLTEV